MRRVLPVCLTTIFVLASGCSDTADDTPAYASLKDSPIRGLTPAEIEELRTGAGAGMALAAELNGYPGPKHILELADVLALSPQQSTAVSRLYNETNQEARAAGQVVLDAHAAVDHWFRDGAGDEAELETLLDDVHEATSALAFVHLRAHLEAFDLLTRHQRALYEEQRGYGAADHASHAHAG